MIFVEDAFENCPLEKERRAKDEPWSNKQLYNFDIISWS